MGMVRMLARKMLATMGEWKERKEGEEEVWSCVEGTHGKGDQRLYSLCCDDLCLSLLELEKKSADARASLERSSLTGNPVSLS